MHKIKNCKTLIEAHFNHFLWLNHGLHDESFITPFRVTLGYTCYCYIVRVTPRFGLVLEYTNYFDLSQFWFCFEKLFFIHFNQNSKTFMKLLLNMMNICSICFH